MSEALVSEPPSVEVVGMSKHFGSLTALDNVSIKFEPGTLHAILGENGAGKSTLVKCIMGYYHADAGEIRIDGAPRIITNPRHAHHLGLGMVYQHFTLVPNMTVAENLVLGEEKLPAVIDWAQQYERLQAFQSIMPFRLDLERPVASLAAGEKQKLEILRQLFLNHRVLILDQPTSVLTPAEAKQILGLMRQMSEQGRLSVVLITHKLREVEEFATEVTVLRAGQVAGGGSTGELTHADLVQLMIGRKEIGDALSRRAWTASANNLEIRGLTVRNDKGLIAVEDASLRVRAGEIVGMAGVSGNGQRELVEVLAGQRHPETGEILANGARYFRTRQEMRRQKIHLLPEEPLRNGFVRSMSISENLAFRNFDKKENTHLRWFVNHQALRRQALDLIQRFRIKTQGPDARIETLSGGNVQRTVLARELSEDVSVLIVQNPCVGLDLSAVAEMRDRIMAVRNAGAGVLLISEDLDEILELADRIVVMFEGRLVYETLRDQADVHTIGQHMASHVLPVVEQNNLPEPSEMTAP
jgi:simple sugar transport system ATP-binding protein